MLEQHDNLLAEFPEHRAKISALIAEDRRFASLVKDYSMLDKKVFSLEAAGTPVTDTVIEDLKKQRLHLKDRIHAALN